MLDLPQDTGDVPRWLQLRALATAVAFQDGRVMVDLPGVEASSSMLLPASRCTLSPRWAELVDADRSAHPAQGALVKDASLKQRIARFAERRTLTYSEVFTDAPAQAEVGAQVLGGRPDYLTNLPLCWWTRQTLSYVLRPSTDAAARLAAVVAGVLSLTDSAVSAAQAMANAAERAPSSNHTAFWWLALATLKLEWQLTQTAPSLPSILRHGPNAHSAPSAPSPDPRHRLPLLGHSTLRRIPAASPTPEAAHLQLLSELARGHGVWQWYVGQPGAVSGDRVRVANEQLSEPLRVYGGGGVGEEGGLWAVLVDAAVAQVADVFVGAWSSQQARLVYGVAQALSEGRSRAPFIDIEKVVG